MKHDDGFNSAQFSADGQRVVTASEDRTARVWDVATGKALNEPMEHYGVVNSAQFSADSVVEMAGFANRKYRPTVSRSILSSRAIRRRDQPRSLKL
jgi:WD40 repeat protein